MTDPQTPPPADNPPEQPAPPVEVAEADEPPASTAGEESHAKPDKFRGEPADAPADTGKPPQVD